MDLGEACEAFAAERFGIYPSNAVEPDVAVGSFSTESAAKSSGRDHGILTELVPMCPSLDPLAAMDHHYGMQQSAHCPAESYFEDEHRFMMAPDWTYDPYVHPYSGWHMDPPYEKHGGSEEYEEVGAWLPTPPQPVFASTPRGVPKDRMNLPEEGNRIPPSGDYEEDFNVSDIFDSFSSAKKGIEEAVSKWLRQECGKYEGGGDCVGSTTDGGTPRSASSAVAGAGAP